MNSKAGYVVFPSPTHYLFTTLRIQNLTLSFLGYRFGQLFTIPIFEDPEVNID